MGRQFRHLGEEWHAETTGTSFGVGSGPHGSQITSWGVEFRCLSDPSKGPFFGRIGKPEISQVPEEELKEKLKDAEAEGGPQQHPEELGDGA